LRQIALLILLFFVAGCFSQHPLVGRWKTSDGKGQESFLYFKSDGTFEALSKGEKLTGQWIYDEEVTPHRLELTFEEQRKVITIAKLNVDQLLIEPREEEDEMPTKFSDKVQKFRRQ